MLDICFGYITLYPYTPNQKLTENMKDQRISRMEVIMMMNTCEIPQVFGDSAQFRSGPSEAQVVFVSDFSLHLKTC